jgi:4-amino-4-deoxy-L-arabinose transferase-like glycosyltransferase
MKKKRHLSFLLLIMLLGFVLRVFYLDKYPPGISWDEVSHGYNAYSILQTGKDEWGKFLPLSNFRAYGDYPLSLNLYLTIPSIAISGLNEFSIRFPHALLGTLTIAASYFLAFGITKSKKISLLTSLLVAIEPFNWFLSRFVAQSNLSVFFLTAALAAFFNREKNKILMPLSVIFLGLTLYSYHTTRIVAPLILLLQIQNQGPDQVRFS